MTSWRSKITKQKLIREQVRKSEIFIVFRTKCWKKMEWNIGEHNLVRKSDIFIVFRTKCRKKMEWNIGEHYQVHKGEVSRTVNLPISWLNPFIVKIFVWVNNVKLNPVWCQFHQDFTRAFFVWKFIQSQNVFRKSCRNGVCTKNSYVKMLMKLTAGGSFSIRVRYYSLLILLKGKLKLF